MCQLGRVAGADLTTTNVEAAGSDWTAAIWQTNGLGLATGPAAGNTFALIDNGTELGNALANTRVRNPANLASATFQGDSLTINANCEFREKSGVNGVVVNFPGVNGNPGLILNGGALNAGSSYALPITVTGKIRVTAQSYISNAAGGAGGGFNTDTGTRQWNLAGLLDGPGNLVLINNKDSVPQQVSNPANTFSGRWIVQCGWLQAVGNGSLGTNGITVDPGYTGFTNDMPLATSPSPAAPDVNFPALTGALFEPDYDLASSGGLTLTNGGLMILHQNCTFQSVSINGVALAPGAHPYSELTNSFPDNFAPGGSGSLTVSEWRRLPRPAITTQPVAALFESRQFGTVDFWRHRHWPRWSFNGKGSERNFHQPHRRRVVLRFRDQHADVWRRGFSGCRRLSAAGGQRRGRGHQPGGDGHRGCCLRL